MVRGLTITMLRLARAVKQQKKYLKEHPDVLAEIEEKVRAKVAALKTGIGAEVGGAGFSEDHEYISPSQEPGPSKCIS